MTARGGTKRKMLLGAVELLRERGSAGVTIDAVLTRTGTPRGSVYHHFPGGRRQLLSEALQLAADAIADMIESAAATGPTEAMHRFVEFWRQLLLTSDFQAVCPAVAVAVSGTEDDRALHPEVAAILTRWHTALTTSLTTAGFPTPRATRLATLTLTSIEGAIILCRTTRSVQPLDDVAAELEPLLAQRHSRGAN
ncbi:MULTISPECIES: TetR/AcrR family transcriptional regulator [unclassified Nocardia]|uniref:TetR/AcrR family transcriptional regulator n=1 Tax=unclassified Nocardia TaxID=2637762 RepID=UPI0024A9C8A7|nr:MULTISPECIES: TetR/AcrR family transcriptional regulator [unclassified Nocardia]